MCFGCWCKTPAINPFAVKALHLTIQNLTALTITIVPNPSTHLIQFFAVKAVRHTVECDATPLVDAPDAISVFEQACSQHDNTTSAQMQTCVCVLVVVAVVVVYLPVGGRGFPIFHYQGYHPPLPMAPPKLRDSTVNSGPIQAHAQPR